MIKQIYSIYDTTAEVYGQPVVYVNEQTFLRDVTMMLKQDTQLSQFPESFSLYHLGEFEDTTGQINLNAEPKFKYKVQELTGTPDG